MCFTLPFRPLLVDDFNNLWVGKSDGLAYIILNEERQIKDIRILKKDVDIKTIVNTVVISGREATSVYFISLLRVNRITAISP